MRRLAIVAALASAAWTAGAAQEMRPSQEYVDYQTRSGETGPDPELETQHYDRQLKLTPEQRKKVLALFEGQREVFQKSSALRERFRKETEALHQRILELNRKFAAESRKVDEAHAASQKRLRALLTPAQRETFDVMQAERDKAEREWRERKVQEDLRRHGGDGKQGRWGGDGDGEGK